MNKKVYDVLLRLISPVGTRVSYAQLAQELSVSVRSIRNYVQTIDELILKAGLPPIRTYPNGEIAFCGTVDDAKQLTEQIMDGGFYLYKLSSEERVHILALIFLSSSGYLTISQLSQQLFVGRSTLIKDLEEVKSYFAGYNIYFDPVKHNGYRLKVNEVDRRNRILRILRPLASPHMEIDSVANIYEKLAYDIFHLSDYVKVVEKLTKSAETKYTYNFTDIEYWMVVILASVILDRLKSGQGIQFLPESYLECTKTSTFAMAKELLQQAFNAFNLPGDEKEVMFFATHVSNITSSSISPRDDLTDIELNIIVKNFLYNVSADILTDIVEDLELQNFLTSHIHSVLKRLRRGEHNPNPYKIQLQKEYPRYYESIKKNIWILESCLNCSYDDDDLSYILMHIAAAVQRAYQRNFEIRVVVACNTGICTSNLLAEKLRRNFKVNIVAVTSTHRLPEVVSALTYDLVVSTVPVNLEGVCWVKVSPILSDNDLLVLHKAFSQITKRNVEHPRQGGSAAQAAATLFEKYRQQLLEYVPAERQSEALGRFIQLEHEYLDSFKLKPSPGSFAGALSPELIALDISAADWKEAIRYVGFLLEKQGKVKSQYISAMVAAVVEKGPYVVYVPGVAVVHAAPQDGALDFAVAFARLRDPINFGNRLNDPVRYVLGVSTVNTQGCIDTVFRMMNVMCSKEMRRRLLEIPNAEGIVQEIKSYELRTFGKG
jgi:mannitol operon transcriptional antiterminator